MRSAKVNFIRHAASFASTSRPAMILRHSVLRRGMTLDHHSHTVAYLLQGTSCYIALFNQHVAE